MSFFVCKSLMRMPVCPKHSYASGPGSTVSKDIWMESDRVSCALQSTKTKNRSREERCLFIVRSTERVKKEASCAFHGCFLQGKDDGLFKPLLRHLKQRGTPSLTC